MANKNDLQIKLLVDVVDKHLAVLTQMTEKLQMINEITQTIDRAQERLAMDTARGQKQISTALQRTAEQMKKMDNAIVLLDRHGQLPGLHKGLTRAHSAAQELAKTMKMIAGPYVLHGTREMYDAGAEMQHAVVQMRQAGMKEEEIERVRKESAELAKQVPLMTQAEIMELHKEARSSVQHPEEVYELMPDLVRARATLKGANRADVNMTEIVKGAESLGLMSNPERFRAYLEGQVKAMVVMGRTINTEQVKEAAQYSKSAGAGLSDEFLNLVLPSLIQESGGSQAGNALAMLVKTLRGGMANRHMTVKTMSDLGLLDEPKKIVRTKTGEIKGYTGRVKGDAILASDPDKWVNEVFRPAAEAAGYKTLNDQIALVNKILPSTAANMVRILLQQRDTLAQHRKLYQGAPGLEDLNKNMTEDPIAMLQQLTTAVQNFAGVLSAPIMYDAAHMLDWLSKHIAEWQKAMAAFNEENPLLGRMIGGGALAAGGTVGAVATYGLLSNLMNGFGLKSSAVALDKAAADLMAAAAAQRGELSSGKPDPKKGGSGWFPWIARVGGVLAMTLPLSGDTPQFQADPNERRRRPEKDDDYSRPTKTWGEFLFGRPQDRIGIGTNQYSTPHLGLLPSPPRFFPAERLPDPRKRETEEIGSAAATAASSLRKAREGVGGLGEAAGAAGTAAGAAGAAVDALAGKVRALAEAASQVPMPRPNPRADLGASLPDRGPGTETR